MENEKLDNLIKNGLMQKLGSTRVEKTDRCPSEIRLSDYLQGVLPKTEAQSVAEHIKNCYWCIEQLDQAQRAQSRRKASLGGKIKRNLTNWIKKNKWLTGAGIAFILSFIFHRYFLQFLILTFLMGIKWIFATGGAKTIVMIYDALRRGGKDDERKEISKNRFII